jgi:hypothetical protein
MVESQEAEKPIVSVRPSLIASSGPFLPRDPLHCRDQNRGINPLEHTLCPISQIQQAQSTHEKQGDEEGKKRAAKMACGPS